MTFYHDVPRFMGVTRQLPEDHRLFVFGAFLVEGDPPGPRVVWEKHLT